jgi:hypothetical protein
MSDDIPPLKTLMARGARKKCPRCGEGPLFKRFNIMHERCAVCGLKYLEDEGALFGTLFLVDRALFILPLIDDDIFGRLHVAPALRHGRRPPLPVAATPVARSSVTMTVAPRQSAKPDHPP